MELIVGVILGSLVSWGITHWYHKKSEKEAPEWAKPLIDSLPQEEPSTEELLAIVQNAINEGSVSPHPIFSHVACPECKAPIDELQETFYDHEHGYFVTAELECPHCGWKGTQHVNT